MARAHVTTAGESERRQSFPNSESEVLPNEHESQLPGRVIALLRIKLESRGKVDTLSKKLAFEKLLINKQSFLMEQLLTDNERLLDQLQALQEEYNSPEYRGETNLDKNEKANVN